MTANDLDHRDKLIERLEQTPSAVNDVIANASDDQLYKAGPGGSLGAVEELALLRDLDELFLERLRRLVSEENPRFERVEDSLWPIERDYLNQDPVASVEQFRAFRRDVVHLLKNISPPDWDRKGFHPTLGRISVHQYVDRVIERDDDHLSRLRGLLGASDSPDQNVD